MAASGRARCRRAGDRRGGAVSGRARCCRAGDRSAGADCPARCCPVEAPHAARSRHPGQCRAGPRRRACDPAGQGGWQSLRRRETAGRERNQRGGRVQATPRPATGLAPGARVSEHPTGRLAARRCALPGNPWRERTAHLCSTVRFRAIQALSPELTVQRRPRRFRAVRRGWLPFRAPIVSAQTAALPSRSLRPAAARSWRAIQDQVDAAHAAAWLSHLPRAPRWLRLAGRLRRRPDRCRSGTSRTVRHR